PSSAGALMLTFLSFFFHDAATTSIYPLSLHDALPIYHRAGQERGRGGPVTGARRGAGLRQRRVRSSLRRRSGRSTQERALGGCRDRKSTRLNSSHDQISYAVFCLKKKKQETTPDSACA